MLPNTLNNVIDSALELLKAEAEVSREKLVRFTVNYALLVGLLIASMVFVVAGLGLVLTCLYFAFLPLVGGNPALAALIDAGFAFVIAGSLLWIGKRRVRK